MLCIKHYLDNNNMNRLKGTAVPGVLEPVCREANSLA